MRVLINVAKGWQLQPWGASGGPVVGPEDSTAPAQQSYGSVSFGALDFPTPRVLVHG